MAIVRPQHHLCSRRFVVQNPLDVFSHIAVPEELRTRVQFLRLFYDLKVVTSKSPLLVRRGRDVVTPVLIEEVQKRVNPCCSFSLYFSRAASVLPFVFIG